MKKIGGYSGPFTLPSKNFAGGSWVSPTEVYAYLLQGAWPVGFTPGTPPALNLGEIFFVCATGVLDDVKTTSYSGSFVIASGGTLSRTTYSGLFNVVGTTFGAGDGSTTFNVIDIPADFSYLKGVTTSGITYSSAYRSKGVLPNHTHVCSVATQIASSQGGNPGGGYLTSAAQTTYYTNNNDRFGLSNEARHQQLIHTVVAKATPQPPVGSVVYFLAPSYLPGDLQNLGVIPENFVVPSGQTLNRTAYPVLFKRLGTTYGSGDGSTTFNVPNLPGLFLRGSSNTNYISISGSLVTSSGYLRDSVARHTHSIGNIYYNAGQGGAAGGRTTIDPVSSNSSDSNIGGSETRPANISVIYFLVAGGLV